MSSEEENKNVVGAKKEEIRLMAYKRVNVSTTTTTSYRFTDGETIVVDEKRHKKGKHSIMPVEVPKEHLAKILASWEVAS